MPRRRSKRDVLVERTLDWRAAYLDVCAHAEKLFNCWDGIYEWNKETRVVHLGARDLGC